VSEWVSDAKWVCYSCIMVRTSYIQWNDDDDVLFVLDQHAHWHNCLWVDILSWFRDNKPLLLLLTVLWVLTWVGRIIENAIPRYLSGWNTNTRQPMLKLTAYSMASMNYLYTTVSYFKIVIFSCSSLIYQHSYCRILQFILELFFSLLWQI
jgi:hypothetical protein